MDAGSWAACALVDDILPAQGSPFTGGRRATAAFDVALDAREGAFFDFAQDKPALHQLNRITLERQGAGDQQHHNPAQEEDPA